MSKNRKLKKRIRQSQRERRIANREDKHHLCFQRKCWRGEFKGKLRQHWYCAAYIPKDTLHHQIHEAISNVPAPKDSSAEEVLCQLSLLALQGAIQKTDSIEQKLTVLIALFSGAEQPTADALRAQLRVVREFNKKPP